MTTYFFSPNNPTTFAEANKALGSASHGRHRLVFADGKTIAIGGDNLAQLVGAARLYCEVTVVYIDPEGPSVWMYEDEQ